MTRYTLLFLCLAFFPAFNAAADADIPAYNATLDGFAYPFDVDDFALESQGLDLQMAYMDLHPANQAKGVVVLLHGKNFSGFYWERIARALVKKSYRVIIPDQIGFGKSSRPQHYLYSFAGLANNTQKLLSSLGVERATIVGHSMGGMLATKFSKYFADTVERLILINPIGLEDYLQYVDYQDPAVFLVNELNKTPSSIRSYQQKNYYDGKWSPAYEALLEPHIGQLKHKDYPLVAMNNALTYNPIFSEPIIYDLPQLNMPVTLIIGTRDRTGPGRAFKKSGVDYQLGQYQTLGKQVAATLQQGQLIELEGLGHMPQFEDWQRFETVFMPLF
ncbi:alpha/beta fold hydrolase [Alteromonas gilva]|uniref:Alpha/beta hydrolase n=1 Tax=Alteromonas gilva TaxID=2987522 RepID=A0ABT5L454_9ALTE|nr:alpha/beta hydrolase [Alteromonas gilva]MDC8830558.1 alpha/beta hydrolase [Alteromonas gilva]